MQQERWTCGLARRLYFVTKQKNHPEGLKEAYRLGKDWIGKAQNQLPELEIRKLTKNNPTMKEKFDALQNKKRVKNISY